MGRSDRTGGRTSIGIARWLGLSLGVLLALPVLANGPELAALEEAGRIIGAQPRTLAGYDPPAHSVFDGFGGGRTYTAQLQGPFPSPPALDTSGMEGAVSERTAPWGDRVTQIWSPYRDARQRPDSVDDLPDPPAPASLTWTWGYQRYRAKVWVGFSYDEEAMTEAAARAVLTPIAEALHRGVVAQGLDRGTAPATGPDRVRITVTQADADPRTGLIEVAGTIESRSPVTGASFFRAEGGTPSSCHLEHDGKRFRGSCEFIPGTRNVFKLVFDNEAQLSAEQTLAYDAAGTMTGQQTTSSTGDVTEEVPPLAPDPDPTIGPPAQTDVPGLGGAAGVPGPRNLVEGLVSILGPGAIGFIGALFSGLLGEGGPAPEAPQGPTETPKKPRKNKRRTARESAEKQTDEAPGEKTGKSNGEQEDKADEQGKRGKKVGRTTQAAPPVPLASSAAAQRALERLERAAKTMASPELAKAVEAARSRCFKPDGSFDETAWEQEKRGLKQAVERAQEAVPKANSVFWDAGAATVGGSIEFAKQAGHAVYRIGKGVLYDFPMSAWEGGKGIVYGLANAKHFKRGLDERTRRWLDENVSEESDAVGKALREGKPWEAVKGLTRFFGTIAAKGTRSLLETAGKALLPVEEFNSLFRDPHASLEEKLWAVPSAALKIANLLLMGQKPTGQPSTAWGKALHRGLDRRAIGKVTQASKARAAALERQVSSLEKAAAKQTGPGGVKNVLRSVRKKLVTERQFQEVAKRTGRLNELSRSAVAEAGDIHNYKHAQRELAKRPELQNAIDEAIAVNEGGNSLHELRRQGVLGDEAQQLLTGRKLQLQEQVVNNAQKRLLQAEIEARLARGEHVPRRFHTYNATQGSRTRLSGSNANCDLDSTLIGTRRVTREQARRIVEEECRALGQTTDSLDINIYLPKRGAADAMGAAPNANVTLERIGQQTGTSGQHQWLIDKDGNVVVLDHVSTAQGREGVLAARRNMAPPPGYTRERWLREGVWEGHQGRPVQIPESQWGQVRRTQLEGIEHAWEAGEMNQMCKYANRARTVGLRLDGQTAEVVRQVAGQKDPLIARRILERAGIRNADELRRRLGV